MTPDRWRRVSEIFHAARGRTPAARAAFLDETCQADAVLRGDVAALLASFEAPSPDRRPGQSQQRPAHQDPPLPQFPAGTTLGPYRLDAVIGAGSQAEVYRAIDRRSQRAVAIKILLPGAADPGFDRRFAREAQLLGSLNHPNIGATYGLEEHEGFQVLVLELVEGPTLAERIARGPLAVREALVIARQITFALEAAHEKGIVHSGLRPANIKIAPDGHVKVLDFGIAPPAGGRIPFSAKPYVSPEQASGEAVDKRSDIWAFGCVLFEMLTGRSPFATETGAVARSIDREPPWQALPAEIPDIVQRLLRHCLQRDPNERLRDIADARLEITDAMALPVRRPHGAPVMTPARWFGVGLGTAALAAIVMFALPWGRTAAGLPVEIGVTFPDATAAPLGVAVSPDGRQLAAAAEGSTPQLWLHTLESGETTPVPNTEGATHPFWSPDSKRLAFFQNGALKAVTLSNGSIADIAKVREAPAGGAWAADGRIIFARGGQLAVVRATGGEPAILKQVPQAGWAGFPQLHPDGRHLLFLTRNQNIGWVTVASLESGTSRRLVASNGAPVFADRDRILYVRGHSIVAQQFDAATLALAGEPHVVANAVGPGALTREELSVVGASPTGVLAFVTERGGRGGRLTWFDRSGRAERSLATPRESEYLNPAIAPNGEQVAVNQMDPDTGNWDVAVVDANGDAVKLTSDAAVESDPIWSPDGRDVVFTSMTNGQLGLYRQSVDPSAGEPPELLYAAKSAVTLTAASWTPDGHAIVYAQTGPDPVSIWLLPLSGGRKPRRLLAGDQPRVSPDGHWLAYVSGDTGTLEVYVQRFPGLGSKQRISEGGGVHPRWIDRGRELVYWARPGGLKMVNIIKGAAVGNTRFVVPSPVLGLADDRTHYDASPDGKRFLVRQPAGPAGPSIKVIRNWK